MTPLSRCHRVNPWRYRIALGVVCGFAIAEPAWAWGSHSEITRAAMAVLPERDAAEKALGDEWFELPEYAWIPDWQSHIRFGVYVDDFLLFPSLPRHVSHMVPDAEATFAPLFRRSLQALRTENSFNAARWIGSLLHYIEDSGSPPHAVGIGGDLHNKMETWLDTTRIRIDGYEPTLLGRTDDEAVRGFEARMERLIEFSRERGTKIAPVVGALADREDQEAILECAQEAARTVADSLYTLFRLALAPIQRAGCSLSGVVRIRDGNALPPTGARIMLAGTEFSTVTDRVGRYSFRDLSPGRVTVLVQATGAETRRVEGIALRRNQPARRDVTLEPDRLGPNILRNARFDLSWYGQDAPDAWRRDEENPKRWASLPVPVPHGTPLRLTIDFVEKPVPVSIRWRADARFVANGSTTAIPTSHVAGTVLSSIVAPDASIGPAHGDAVFVELLIETDKSLRDVCRGAALIPVTAEPTEK